VEAPSSLFFKKKWNLIHYAEHKINLSISTYYPKKDKVFLLQDAIHCKAMRRIFHAFIPLIDNYTDRNLLSGRSAVQGELLLSRGHGL